MVASKELTDDVRLAHVMADDADSISMSRFKAQDLMIKTKPDSTPVTEADTAVEESIRRTLSRTRPRDAVHGEEMQDTGESNRRWIIDPIDGTANYLRGVPVWATLIALELEGQIVASVVSAPIACEPELALYDMAALDIIVREAGGRFTSIDGKPGPYHGNALATNGLLHDVVLERLRPSEAG